MVENGIQTVAILERIATTLVVVITQALAREAVVAVAAAPGLQEPWVKMCRRSLELVQSIA